MTTIDELQRRVETLEGMQAESRIIYQLSHRLHAARDEVELLQILAQPSVDTHFAWAAFSYVDLNETNEPTGVEVAAVWPQDGGSPFSTGMRYRLTDFPLAHQWLASPDKPLLFANVVIDPAVDNHSREVMAQSGTRALAIIPSAQNERWSGLICLGWDRPHVYSEQEITLYQVFTNLAPPIVENWRLKQPHRRDRAERLYRLGRGLNAADRVDEMLYILAESGLAPNVSKANLMYIDLDEGGDPAWIEVVAAWPQEDAALRPVGERYTLPEFPLAQLGLASPDEPLLITNVATDERLDQNTRQACTEVGHQAVIVIPLVQAGRWTGLVSFGWNKPREFGEGEELFYRELPSLVTPIVSSQRLRRNLEEERTDLRQQLTRIDDEHTRLQKQFTKITEERTQLQQQLTGVEGERTGLQEELAEVKADQNQLQQRLSGVEEERAQLQQQLSGVEEERTQLQQQLTGVEGERTGLQEELAEVKADQNQLQQRLSGVEEERAQLQQQLSRIEEERTQLQQQLTEVEGGRTQLQQQLEEERERAKQQLVEAQQRVIYELPTPIIPLMGQIVIIPLIGCVDAGRAEGILDALLPGIKKYQPKIAVLDITGVPEVDNEVAGYLDRIIQAIQAQGVQTTVIGLPEK